MTTREEATVERTGLGVSRLTCGGGIRAETARTTTSIRKAANTTTTATAGRRRSLRLVDTGHAPDTARSKLSLKNVFSGGEGGGGEAGGGAGNAGSLSVIAIFGSLSGECFGRFLRLLYMMTRMG